MVRDVDAAEPMLSAPVPEPRLRPGWAAELKWDGFRALVCIDAGKVVLRSRRGTEMGPAFPEVVAGAGQLPDATALDGELVVREHGRLAFERLQDRLQRWGSGAVRAADEAPAHFVAKAAAKDGSSPRTKLKRPSTAKRVIFRDPTRNLPVGDLKGVPQSVPSDVLAGLLDQVTTPLERLAIALVAVHAVALSGGVHPPARLRVADLRPPPMARFHQPPPAGQSEKRTRPRPAGRQHRPASGSPPQRADTGRLRQDRILNEAFETADPLKLMRLFGITEQTAMRYVAAAHPERTAELPQ
nr:hypothetical protein [Streptomyces africanus]